MWTLILVVFLVSGSSNGGVGTATSFLDFQNEAKCRTAADVMMRRRSRCHQKGNSNRQG
jgi:hypothetical protein